MRKTNWELADTPKLTDEGEALVSLTSSLVPSLPWVRGGEAGEEGAGCSGEWCPYQAYSTT